MDPGHRDTPQVRRGPRPHPAIALTPTGRVARNLEAVVAGACHPDLAWSRRQSAILRSTHASVSPSAQGGSWGHGRAIGMSGRRGASALGARAGIAVANIATNRG